MIEYMMNKHNENGVLLCEHCNDRYLYNTRMIVHMMRKHNENGEFQCDYE